MSSLAFKQALEHGVIGESVIAQYWRRRGCSVLPAYEVEEGHYEGPRLYTPEGKLIVPDMVVFRGREVWWLEAKHKTAFSHHRITNRFVTGIDLPLYLDYCKIDDFSPWPVCVFFLHDGGQAKDSPPDSPSGLFGASLRYLRRNENHRHPNGGKRGMVYWDINKLKKYATLEEIEREMAIAFQK